MKQLALLLILFTVPAAFGQSSQTTSVKVFFANEQKTEQGKECDGLVYPVTRQVKKTSSVARAALEQLLAGPTESEKAQGYRSFFSDETKSMLLGVKIKKGTAYVNFKDTRNKLGNATASCGSTDFLAQLEKTVLQFPGIKRVFFAVEGDPREFYEWLQEDGCPQGLKNCDKTNFK
ncbi:MAG TPA: GerMN domain-containing protein [Pyrinomonadaceae bacterium]|nr:GerMN domain-containing protein [Pyrinomonadaceae bacterium]